MIHYRDTYPLLLLLYLIQNPNKIQLLYLDIHIPKLFQLKHYQGLKHYQLYFHFHLKHHLFHKKSFLN